MALKFSPRTLDVLASRLHAVLTTAASNILLYPSTVPFPSGQVTTAVAGSIATFSGLGWTLAGRRMYVSSGTLNTTFTGDGTISWAMIRVGTSTYFMPVNSVRENTDPLASTAVVKVSTITAVNGQAVSLIGAAIELGDA